MSASNLHPIVEQIAEESGEAVLLEIVVSTVTDTSYDEQVSRAWARDGFVRFQIDDGALSLRELDTGNFLRAVSQTARLEQIPDALQEANLDWVWVDFYIGVELALHPNPGQSSTIWNDADVWKRTLRPWLAWIR